MHIVVNGKARDVPRASTIAELIESLGLRARSVVVERNAKAIERERFDRVVLSPGDIVEIVRPVQGG